MHPSGGLSQLIANDVGGMHAISTAVPRRVGSAGTSMAHMTTTGNYVVVGQNEHAPGLRVKGRITKSICYSLSVVIVSGSRERHYFQFYSVAFSVLTRLQGQVVQQCSVLSVLSKYAERPRAHLFFLAIPG